MFEMDRDSVSKTKRRVVTRTRRPLPETLRRVVAEFGEDGKGREGNLGYFRNWARSEPESFCVLLGRYLRSCDLHYREYPEEVPKISRSMSAQEAMDIYRRFIRAGHFGPKHLDPDLSPLLLAAQQVGEDGKGRDGLAGFLRNLARNYPKSFRYLLTCRPQVWLESSPNRFSISDEVKMSPEEKEKAIERHRKMREESRKEFGLPI
jgi:hypothetical protein